MTYAGHSGALSLFAACRALRGRFANGVPMDFSALVEWSLRQVRDRAASPMPVAYLTLCPREGSAYPQRARIDVDGCADLSAALREECADLVRSSEADDRPVSRVKVRVYGPKGAQELASSTFRVSHAADDDAPVSSTREGELIAVVREQRLMLQSSYDTIQRQTAGAFAFGMETLKGQQELQRQIGELTGALVIAEQGRSTVMDQLKPLLEAAAPALPLLLAKMTGGAE